MKDCREMERTRSHRTFAIVAWYVLTATIMNTIEYPLLALTLTEQERNYIMAPVLMRGLLACGIC